MLLNDAVDVKVVQAHSPVVPVRFRADKRSFSLWAIEPAMVSTPPRIDLSTFSDALGAELDYVILWGPIALLETNPQGRRLISQLHQLYQLVYVSSDTGLLHVYQRTPN